MKSPIKLPQNVTRTLGKATLNLRKFSPEILTTVGVVGVVATVVLASRATLKAKPIVETMQGNVEILEDIRTEDNAKKVNKDLVRVYSGTALELTKLYAPAVTLGVASIGCILGAHGILSRRNVALTAAYKTLETGFSEYRKRMQEELGEDREREVALGLKEEEIEQPDGQKITVGNIDPNQVSPYARVFAKETTSQWANDASYNLFFLKAQQEYFTQILQAKGYVFLSDVYKALGFEETTASRVVGWFLEEDADNYVDFGLYTLGRTDRSLFINGDEKAVWLDFNVNGVIHNKLKRDI